ncbi:flagellar hook assembly protein FlgD [Halomonas daqiaonensis]|uniref:Basal-body rod modification protein FlgD n=1 Tax=Halomonas daqiaonensis TaxID=650850 RepID=A0A1H7ST28_9GAMM|nr:flagellar hook assembly protein FlgD [Halomonas daqiaonensis]SEL74667.1 flagellar basal-body rod modification protein FlgD [Halomonas daqiaonensis]
MATTIDSSVINSLNAGGPSANQAAKQSGDLRDNFMTLLVTQLKNQDPLNPMDNNETTSQLAQINTVSGIEELNQSLKDITGQINAGQALQASGLIGQGVLVPGNRVLLNHGEGGEVNTTPFGIELDAPADNAKVTITNGAGEVVNRYDIGAVSAGVESFRWDGLTSDGQKAAEGAYQVSIEATRGDKPLAAETLNYAMVNGITPVDDNGSFSLDLGAIYGQVGIADVKQIL